MHTPILRENLLDNTNPSRTSKKERPTLDHPGWCGIFGCINSLVLVHASWFLGKIARARLCRLPPTGRTLFLYPRTLLPALRSLHGDVPWGNRFAGISVVSRTQGEVSSDLGDRGAGAATWMVRSGWHKLLPAFLPKLYWHLRTKQPAQIDHRNRGRAGDWHCTVCVV